MARALTSGYAPLITPGLRKVYFSTLADIAKEFRQLFNVLGADPGGQAGRSFFDDYQISSLGTAGEKPEGEAIQYDIPVSGNTLRYTNFAFGIGFRVTEEMQSDDLYTIMQLEKMTRQCAMACAHQMEVQAHRILTGGFGTTGGTGFTAAGFDGLALFSDAHTLLRGGTRANKLSVDLDLSITAVEQAQDLFETWVNHSGFPTPRKVNLLVVPPKLKWVAKEITESELKPYTGDNEINPLGGEGFKYMVDHYIADTEGDNWYLFAPKAEHDCKVWIRKEPQLQTGDDFDTGDAKVKATFRMAEGHSEPDGVFGSQGA